MELIIDDRQDKLNVSEELIEKIKDIIIECLDYEGYDDDYEVSLSFVDNKEIHELNKQFRGIDRPTDVLSFPMLSDDFDIELEEESLGDIVISLERARAALTSGEYKKMREILIENNVRILTICRYISYLIYRKVTKKSFGFHL